MNPDDLKKKIEIAKASIEGMPEDEYKKIAFEVILNKAIDSDDKLKKRELKDRPEKIFTSETKTELPPRKVDVKGITKLCQDAEITEDQFNSVFDIEGDNINIIKHIKEKKSADEQFKVSLMLLTVGYYVTGSQDISSSMLRRKLEDHEVGSLVNLSTNLKTQKSYIFKKPSKKGSTSTSYKITQPGISKGLMLIKEIEGDENE